MNQKDEHYDRYFMTHSSYEFMQYIQQSNVYYPKALEQKLLKWNSYPIVCQIAQEIEQCFGILFFQMIKISQNQFVRNNFETWINKDLNQQHDFSQLAKQIFKKESLNPFPQSTEFQSIGEQLKEAFIYEKHLPDKVPSIFKWNNGNQTDNLSEQDIKYRILFYQSSDKFNFRIYFVFSTNNENIMTQFKSQYQQSQIDRSHHKFNTQNQQQFNQYTIQQNNQSYQINQQSHTQLPTNNNQFFGQQQQLNNMQSFGQQQQLNNTLFVGQQQQLNNNQFFGQQQQFNSNQFLGQQQQFNSNQFAGQQQQLNTSQLIGQQQQLNNSQLVGQQQQLNNSQLVGQQPNNPQFSGQQKNNQFFGGQQTNNQQYPGIYNQQFSGQQQNNQFFGGQQTNNQQYPGIYNQQFLGQQQNNLYVSQSHFPRPQVNLESQYQQQQQSINFNKQGQKQLFQSTQPQQTQHYDQYQQKQQKGSEQPTYQNEAHTVDDDAIFTTQQINQIQEKKSQDKLSSGNYPRILTNYSQNNQNNIQQCLICVESYNINSTDAVISPCCNQKLHAQCVQADLFQKAQSGLEQVNCYNCQASLNSFPDFLKNQIAHQVFVEQVKKQVLSKIPMQCFKCQMPIYASQQSLQKQFKLECSQCHTILCSLCRQEYHGENKQNQQCPGLSKQILIAIQGMPVLVCPFCNLMQTKDQGCNHVKCYGCQNDLCSACSADRIPIIAHGNHYHRKGCPDYKVWEFKGKVKTDKEYNKNACARCKETQKPCEYPISLEEYKKQKNF